ncbi:MULTISPECIES: anthranilate phosphoribosyltransferase [unclassified Dysgonomonas]|jgi:anthranilate phosphoribosyltransferase|uniref:anthranilate phosphoribosyltransferase n=1 Tax=unclassified Dysgonomonas TaxID=2630389 RepID=UPI0025C416D9|nr:MULTISPECIES: anthranilate phosphoribosyltransferase [unclassified Dysgonomonas]MDR2002293.1 anthranilate phosphoribosyltransferase [Prevotella sp.]HMM04699.1 anthranilate phosphoribosyltransferase [Dysgonomonas sp.]
MKQILNRLFEHQYLNRTEAKEILTNMAAGNYNESQIAAFISVFLMRSISVDEFLGFSDALLDLRANVDALAAYNPIDIVGTGGDNKNTFNISTLACFVTAGAGYKVAKHGNYGATSVSGASNVMEQHGVKFTADVSKLEESLDKTNIAYMHAPLFNNALKVVAPVRKALGVRTFFNMLGPVVNPIKPKRTVLGVFNLKMARLYSYMYQQTDVDYSIVHGLDGYDEISLTGDFKIINKFEEKIYTPEQVGFDRCLELELDGGNTPEDASTIFDNVISNTATKAQINAVIANAATAIQTINPQLSFEDAIAEARESLESGKTKETFLKFLTLNT